jgi:hypothetical protein
MSYSVLSSAACDVKIWNNPRYRDDGGADRLAISLADSGAEAFDGRRYLKLTGLTASTDYFGKRWCGEEVDVFTFRTTSAAATHTLHVTGAPVAAVTAVVESGVSPGSLNAGTPVECSATCTLTVPAGDAYYRVAYRAASGTTISRTAVVLAP